MIRRARASEVPVLEAMLREMYGRSKYLGRVEISEKAMREALTMLIMNELPMSPHSSMVRVSEQDGEIVGFIAGQFDRVYHIGRRIRANDVFLYVKPNQSPKHMLALIDAYVAWARSNPKVVEIVLSWTDALPGAARIGDLYARKGFAKIGEMYELRLDEPALEEAA